MLTLSCVVSSVPVQCLSNNQTSPCLSLLPLLAVFDPRVVLSTSNLRVQYLVFLLEVWKFQQSRFPTRRPPLFVPRRRRGGTVDVSAKGMTSKEVAEACEAKGINVRIIDDKTVGLSFGESITKSDVETLVRNPNIQPQEAKSC